MHQVHFVKSVKKIDDLYSAVRTAYTDENIPVPYPAANKQLQGRLKQFVANGLTNNQSISMFDKVNSNRVYALEKDENTIRLMLFTKENEETKKRIVLPVDEEIRMIVSSFLNVFRETGYIESAPRCHKRLADVYAISDKRIRLVQRTVARLILPAAFLGRLGEEQVNVHGSVDDDCDTGSRDDKPFKDNLKPGGMCNDENSPPSPPYTAVTTRSRSKRCEIKSSTLETRCGVMKTDKRQKKSQ